jgi:hypothetical protein
MFKGVRSIYQRRLADDDVRDLTEIMAGIADLTELIQACFDRGVARDQALARLMECGAWCDLALRAKHENPKTEERLMPSGAPPGADRKKREANDPVDPRASKMS